MISRTNIKTQLEKTRAKRIGEASILNEVNAIFKQNDVERDAIKTRLENKSVSNQNQFDFDLLVSENIYHVADIKTLCVDYRLRFLDSRYFKGPFPDEAISKIRSLENEHDTTLKGFKIVAPAKLMKLENADDPLLFAPMGNGYFYLIHKWGKDLHPFRKLLMWPYKSFENLIVAILFLSIALTMLVPMELFSRGNVNQEYVLMFLFMFKGVAGVVLFYGFAKGKNFNGAIWNSTFYNA